MPIMKCCTTSCNKTEGAGLRGLCMMCYSSAKKMVAAGRATWEQLERMGLARPKASDDLFAQEFDKLSSNPSVNDR